MDIKDCKIGTRVVCVDSDEDIIPVGAVGTIIEDDSHIPWVSFDEKYSDKQQEVFGYKNCKVMELDELEVLKESRSKETNIGNLSVSVSTENVNEIARDIIKVVLQEIPKELETLSKNSETENEIKESVMEQDVLNSLLKCIDSAINIGDDDAAVKLSEAYQLIKSVSNT